MSGKVPEKEKRKQSLATAIAILLHRLRAREIAKTRRLCFRAERLPGEGPRALQCIEAKDPGEVAPVDGAEKLRGGLWLMEMPPDRFGSLARHNSGKGFSCGLLHVAQAAEVGKQALASLRADAGNVQQL